MNHERRKSIVVVEGAYDVADRLQKLGASGAQALGAVADLLRAGVPIEREIYAVRRRKSPRSRR